MRIVQSIHAVPIRLSDERIAHIERRHPEMKGEAERILDTVATPDFVQEGDASTLLALKHYLKTPLTSKYCVVVYRELNDQDGFVLTAYFTTRYNERRQIIWKP
jgi:hypothetical protein